MTNCLIVARHHRRFAITSLYHVRIRSVEGDTLVCRVTDVYRGFNNPFPASRSMAFWFLWEPWRAICEGWFFVGGLGGLSADQAQVLAQTASIGKELRDPDYCDEDWNRANGGRFINCVGVYDLYSGTDEDDCPREEMPQATYMITATDPRWFDHLRVGMEWETTAYDCDKKIVIRPAWISDNVRAIAQVISKEGAFDDMPILADALQDAGCEDQKVLNHCRSLGRHAQGCWLLGLLLERNRTKRRRRN